MKTAFNFKTGSWQIGWPERVSRYDVVYLSPPIDPMQGMALGNGETGALCWCEDSKIVIVLNRSDLWDDIESETIQNWRLEEEEASTTLRHGCRLIIDLGFPVFDTIYLSDFKGRLSLSDATAAFSFSGPFGSGKFRAFVSHDDGVLCCDVETDFEEDSPIEVWLERYGSRTFSHWYSRIKRDPRIGVPGTESSIDNETAVISHQLTTGKFLTGARVLNTENLTVSFSKKSNHRSGIIVAGNHFKKFNLIASVSQPSYDESIGELQEVLDRVERLTIEQCLHIHGLKWKGFWLRSYLDTGGGYLDNLWHLTMYYALSSQSGRYPGNFINGLWAWNRDVKNWNFYFHWNQQQIYWPLNAAGHHELCVSYLNYRFQALSYGRKDARDIFGVDGAVVSDVADGRGCNSTLELENHTPVAQVAMDFWRQFQYTKDPEFLAERALPYMLEAARFFESLFVKGDDGKFHCKGTGYEGWIVLRDVVSELVYAKVLFSSVVEALQIAGQSDPRSSRWLEIVDNVAPVCLVDGHLAGYIDESGSLITGDFKGSQTSSRQVVSAGFGVESGKPENSMLAVSAQAPVELPIHEMMVRIADGSFKFDLTDGDNKCNDGIFPWVEYSCVFPSGLVGISQKGAALFRAAQNTAKAFSPMKMGWDVLPIVFARLGMVEETWTTLAKLPGLWQHYVNGWGHWGTLAISKADHSFRFRQNMVSDVDDTSEGAEDRKFPFPTWPFRHMGMESMSVLATAMNESLLQCHEGIIRVAPSVLPTQAGRFTLHARGGFVVSSELQNGEPLWVVIESQNDSECKIENPWNVLSLYLNGLFIALSATNEVSVGLKKGDVVWLFPEGVSVSDFQTQEEVFHKNVAPKASPCGLSSLGIPRSF